METRAALLNAAARLFFANGVGGTTLDQIASAAGVTKGAIYDHFSGKNDILFQLLASRGNPLLDAIAPEKTGADQLRAIALGLIEAMPSTTRVLAMSLEMYHHVASNPDLGERVVHVSQTSLQRVAERLDETGAATAAALAPIELALAITALNTGLLFNRLIAPDLVSDEVAERLFARVLGVAPEVPEAGD